MFIYQMDAMFIMVSCEIKDMSLMMWRHLLNDFMILRSLYAG